MGSADSVGSDYIADIGKEEFLQDDGNFEAGSGGGLLEAGLESVGSALDTLSAVTKEQDHFEDDPAVLLPFWSALGAAVLAVIVLFLFVW